MLQEGAVCYEKLLVATGRWWLLQEGAGFYRELLVATERWWLLHEASGCYMKVLVATRSWLLLYTGSCRMLKKLWIEFWLFFARNFVSYELFSRYWMNRTTFKHCFDKQDCLWCFVKLNSLKMLLFTLIGLTEKLSEITRFRRKVKGLKTLCAGRLDLL